MSNNTALIKQGEEEAKRIKKEAILNVENREKDEINKEKKSNPTPTRELVQTRMGFKIRQRKVFLILLIQGLTRLPRRNQPLNGCIGDLVRVRRSLESFMFHLKLMRILERMRQILKLTLGDLYGVMNLMIWRHNQAQQLLQEEKKRKTTCRSN